MTASNKIAMVAACAGDPARASMLSVLADGRAFTAGELSAAARVTPQTASGHLARMREAGLLTVEKQGRHRYYRLASATVAQMLESMMVIAAPNAALRAGPASDAMRLARTCYDHLAGQVAVAIAGRLVADGHLLLSDDGGEVTASGRRFLARLGIDLEPGRSHRAFCRPCLDWSERRHHLAGTLGARMLQQSLSAGWIRRRPQSRAVDITPLGRRRLRDLYGIEFGG